LGSYYPTKLPGTGISSVNVEATKITTVRPIRISHSSDNEVTQVSAYNENAIDLSLGELFTQNYPKWNFQAKLPDLISLQRCSALILISSYSTEAGSGDAARQVHGL
jgi:hypothetical protein